MFILVALMGLCVAGLIGIGLYLDSGRKTPPAWLRGGVLVNLTVFALALVGLLFLGVDQAMAQEAAAPAHEISLGMGLALLGIGLPTGIAAIAAGIALASIGSAGLAVIAEKPELFGRTLVFMGLAEGIAIYGLVMSILLLGKL
jgi:V/A-type H+-transporting ATPase subunit K